MPMAEPDVDALLVDRARRGDNAAFEMLVVKYQRRIERLIARMVRDADLVQDVAQETFIRAYRAMPQFRGESAFYTWLYRIAFNTAISSARRKKTHASIEQCRESVGLEPLGRDEAPTEGIERDERAVQVRSALASLPHDYRVVVVLREIDGCDYEQISEILDVPVGTVRSRLHRARLQLKDHLKAAMQIE